MFWLNKYDTKGLDFSFWGHLFYFSTKTCLWVYFYLFSFLPTLLLTTSGSYCIPSFLFQCPFLSYPFYPSSCCHTLSPPLLLSPPVSLPPSASVIRAATEQCLQGLPRGLPVWHIHFTATHLALPSILWSNYRGRNRKHSPTPSQPLPPLLCSPRDGRLVGGHLIFLLIWSLFTLGILVALQSLLRPDCNMIIWHSLKALTCCAQKDKLPKLWLQSLVYT